MVDAGGSVAREGASRGGLSLRRLRRLGYVLYISSSSYAWLFLLICFFLYDLFSELIMSLDLASFLAFFASSFSLKIGRRPRSPPPLTRGAESLTSSSTQYPQFSRSYLQNPQIPYSLLERPQINTFLSLSKKKKKRRRFPPFHFSFFFFSS